MKQSTAPAKRVAPKNPPANPIPRDEQKDKGFVRLPQEPTRYVLLELDSSKVKEQSST